MTCLKSGIFRGASGLSFQTLIDIITIRIGGFMQEYRFKPTIKTLNKILPVEADIHSEWTQKERFDHQAALWHRFALGSGDHVLIDVWQDV